MGFATCKYCGEKIFWAPMPEGHYLPMDPDGGGLHGCTEFERYTDSSGGGGGGSAWLPVPPCGARLVALRVGVLGVSAVVAESPGSEAGLRQDDHIVDVDEQKVRTVEEFDRIWNSLPTGGTITLGVIRGGKFRASHAAEAERLTSGPGRAHPVGVV